jgi:hypothetical protein
MQRSFDLSEAPQSASSEGGRPPFESKPAPAQSADHPSSADGGAASQPSNDQARTLWHSEPVKSMSFGSPGGDTRNRE